MLTPLERFAVGLVPAALLAPLVFRDGTPAGLVQFLAVLLVAAALAVRLEGLAGFAAGVAGVAAAAIPAVRLIVPSGAVVLDGLATAHLAVALLAFGGAALHLRRLGTPYAPLPLLALIPAAVWPASGIAFVVALLTVAWVTSKPRVLLGDRSVVVHG